MILHKKETEKNWINGQTWADSAVLPACSGGLGATASTERRVNEMSAHGLRTLVYGHKEIDQDRFVKFVNDLDIARSSIVNR